MVKPSKNGEEEEEAEPANDSEVVCSLENVPPKINGLGDLSIKILSSIFIYLDDLELYQIAASCQRFRVVAQIVFKERYVNKYFVINGSFKRRIHRHFLNHFGRCIKAFEIRHLHGIYKGHWVIRLLSKYHQIRKLCFVNCVFTNVQTALSNHKQITHLAFCGGCAFGFKKLSGFHCLKEFKIRHFDGMYYPQCNKLIEKNHQLETLEVVDDSFHNPLEIVECANQHLKHLHKLCVINEAMPLERPLDDAMMNSFTDLFKGLLSFGISTDNHSIQLLQRLSIDCEKVEHLELFHVDKTFANEMVDAIHRFEAIKSLSLVIKQYEGVIVSIVKQLPNLVRLSISYRCQTPSSNDYILSLLRESNSLMEIIVDTHIDKFKPKQPKLNENFHDEFHKIVQNRPNGVQVELKEEGKTISTVTKKTIAL